MRRAYLMNMKYIKIRPNMYMYHIYLDLNEK